MSKVSRKKESPVRKGLSRRKFLKGFSISSVGLIVTGEGIGGKLRAAGLLPAEKILGPDVVQISLQVNGKKVPVVVEPRMTLADVLRDQLHFTGTKVSCDRGACGSCTVILGGKNVNSCLVLVVDTVGIPIETIEGLRSPTNKLHPLQESFIEHDAMQCGFCTPGMIMSCKHLLDNHPHPTPEQIKKATSGNLCRCGTYPNVFAAVLATGKK